MNIKGLFTFETGKLDALEKTDEGNIPLIYGTAENNGVVKFVTVDDESFIFQPPLITVSYLGTSFVQTVPFTTSVVDKSNIIILKPIKSMSLEELYFYCYQINKHGKFGFNYGRRMNMARLSKLEMIEYTNNINCKIPSIDFDSLKPKIEFKNLVNCLNFSKVVPINSIFDVVNAKSHSVELYDDGDVAFVSNGTLNKGIIKFVTTYETDRVFNKKAISISAFCEAIMQEPPFIARGNGGSGLVVLIPKNEMDEALLLTYASYFNNFCRWRFNYGRMVSLQRLNKLKIPDYDRDYKFDIN